MNLLVGDKNLDVDFSKLVESLVGEYRTISTEYENTGGLAINYVSDAFAVYSLTSSAD